jgi:hypothetical protein
MRKLFICIFCTFFVMPLLASEADSSVIFRAEFLKNEIQQYIVSLSTFSVTKGDTTAYEKLQSKVDVYVADSSVNQYIITWRFYDFSINTSNRNLKDLIEKAKPVKISYRTSRQGELNEFISWEETSTCLEDGMKVVLERFASRKDSLAKAEVKNIFAFRESLETMMLRSIRDFHQAYGLGYNLNEDVDVPAEIFGLVSSEPVQGITRKRLTGIDRNSNLAMLSTATFPDRNSLKEAFEKYYPGVSVPLSLLNQSILGGIVSDLKTGWIFYTFEQRDRVKGSVTNSELLEIKHIDN